MQNRFKKNSLVLSIIIFILFCITFFYFYKEIKTNIQTSKDAQVNLQKEVLRRTDIKNFNESFQTIEADKALFETHFVQGSDIVPFLDTIEKMASSVGTKAEVSLIEVSKDNSGLILEMKDTGTFSQVYKFITLLENSPYELEFTSVEMRSLNKDDVIKNSNKENEWETTLKINLISFV